MTSISSRRLNIFIDETGEFAFGKRSAKLYGVSFVFHEQSSDIARHIDALNGRLKYLDYDGMIHMGDLVTGHGDYKDMDTPERRKIFTTLYRFSMEIPAKYTTIIINKKHLSTTAELKVILAQKMRDLVFDNLEYFQSFDEIVIYYDDGQLSLGRVIDRTFSQFSGYERRKEFDHTKKKLFQVADMLTYVDKIAYKYKSHMEFTSTEKRFFSIKDVKKLLKERSKKDLK